MDSLFLILFLMDSLFLILFLIFLIPSAVEVIQVFGEELSGALSLFHKK
jgi:hypothetical protein